MPAYSKPQIDASSTSLNPIVFYPRFLNIAEDIMKKVDVKTLKNCREVEKSWQNCIDDQKILWKKIVNDEGSDTIFQFACKNGHFKMVEMLIENIAVHDIDLNAQDEG